MARAGYEQVTKVYSPDAVAVDDLTLEVKDREFLVVVGPSGYGKSTALRMLAGLEEVRAGTVTIGDRVVNDVPATDRDIAMVFQSYALYPHMTVFDNIAFGLKTRQEPKSEIHRKVGEAAQILGLEQLLERRPAQLSSGQRQRVALGRAIVRHPEVFLLDEPLSNLDAKLRVQTRIELQRLHKRLGATFVYVTHDQVEAMSMGDLIAVMRDGVLQQAAPPRELYEHPANMYVAGFIGSPTMNFIPVTISGRTARASGFTLELDWAPGIECGVVGIRPEAFAVHHAGEPGGFELKVEVVEELGSDVCVYGAVGNGNSNGNGTRTGTGTGTDPGTDPLTERIAPDLRVSAGDRLRLSTLPRRLHVFDAATERRLVPPYESPE